MATTNLQRNLKGVVYVHKRLTKVGLAVVIVIALLLAVTPVVLAQGRAGHNNSNSTQIPTITKLNPKKGPAAGGITVVIHGTGFSKATGVSFGTTAATSFKVLSNRVIKAVAPAGTGGTTVDITVTNGNGTSAVVEADKFKYQAPPAPVVKDIVRRKGPAAGGETVFIMGSGFGGTKGVMFGSVAATSFTVLNSHLIKAIAPAGTAGQTVDITVTTPVGTSQVTKSDHFTYLDAALPTTTSTTPSPTTTSGN